MAEFKTAFGSETSWVDARCSMCDQEFACLVSATGFVDTGFLRGFTGLLPSDDDMRGALQADIREQRQLGVARVPCPHCGNFSRRWVEAVHAKTRKIVGWVSLAALFIGVFGLLAVVVPDLPAWTLVLVLAGSWLGSKLIAAAVVDRVDPNRDLEANKRAALAGVQRGVLKLPSQP